jgi:transposase-like protein
MTKGGAGIMAVLAAGAAGRRRFSEEDKRRIVDEATQPGCSVSKTARRYGIAVRVLFRWKEALKGEPAFAPVQVTDAVPVAESPTAPSAPGIEIELVGGRRVRFEHDADPEAVQRLVALLEGGGHGPKQARRGARPVLKQGLIDVVIVYKVDRLTRLLAGFAKIVEILDGHGASFLSITQQFNTTSSMSRLMLNVLLSFAQFQREVMGERIRDKIAASKRKACGWAAPCRWATRFGTRDGSYGHAATRRLAAMGIRDHPTTPRSPLAERAYGEADRLEPSGMPRSHRRLWRRPLASNPWCLHHLLQRTPNACVVGRGFAGPSAHSTARSPHRAAPSRRTSSSILPM